MTSEWWYWLVAGIVLVVAELAVPAMVLVWFGLGGILVGLILLAIPSLSLTAQIAIWTLASVGLVVLWFKLFKPSLHKTRVGMSTAAVLGEVGMLTRGVAPFQKGQVRFQKPIVGSDVWDCIADEAIKSGDRVKVLGIEGSFLKVGRA